jgi:macrolide-specific efflux system membrane fusion protein
MAKTKRFRTRRSRATLAVVCVAVLALVAFFVYRGVAGNATASPTYTTGTVQTMTLTSSVSGTGNIEYSNTAAVDLAVGGEVRDLSVELGDAVAEGQVLFTLVNPQLDVAVADAQNAYDRAVLAVDQAGLELLSAKTSLAGTYSRSHTALAAKQAAAAVTSAALAVQAAENAVSSAEIALLEAKENAAARSVTAPMAGVITALTVQDGDSLEAGGAGASSPLTITDAVAYRASVVLAESDISAVEVGQKAVLTLDALPDLTLSGRVTRVDAVGTNNSGVVSYTVAVTPDVMDPQVKGGMTVSVNIITDVAADVLAVPNAAVKSSAGGNYVQILQNGEPVNIAVETGLSNDSYTEITSGLTEGQEIITATSTSNSKTTSTTNRLGGPSFDRGEIFIQEGGPAGGVMAAPGK